VREPEKQRYVGTHDGQSDRSILRYEQTKDGVIVQRSEFTVAFHERSDEESGISTVKTSMFRKNSEVKGIG